MTTPRSDIGKLDRPRPARRRAIGRWGTASRLVVGVLLLADVAFGHWVRGFHLAAWALGLIGFPAILLAAQWVRARRGRGPARATGPAGHAANADVFLALYLTPQYAPALSVTSDAALIFYGARCCWPAAGLPAAKYSPCPTGRYAATTRSAACSSRPSTTQSTAATP